MLSRPRSLFALALLFLLGLASLPALSPVVVKSLAKFRGEDFYLRFSKGDLHELTPVGQEDLQKWRDMLTFNFYPKVKDGEGLAQGANAVLNAYKEAKAIVVRTNSIPAQPGRPAEHLVAVLFPRPDYIEAAFTRFVLRDGRGVGITYSHRKYGKVGNEMSDWLKANGPAIEKELMAFDAIPKLETAK
ncbi:MAG: hypothetical protein JSR82_06100 [Verrucomicrobia bacterium]|nr:hypothetical protein [Verrucomicrobiota bacterium]